MGGKWEVAVESITWEVQPTAVLAFGRQTVVVLGPMLEAIVRASKLQNLALPEAKSSW